MWNLLIGPVAGVIDTVLKRVLPVEKISEAEHARLEQELTLEMAKIDWQAIAGQLQINLEEAKHESVFVAGWRPFVGWTCGAAFAFHFIAVPVLLFGRSYLGWGLPSALPEFDMQSLLTVLLGMLGLGGMRTFEKLKGVNKSR